MIEYIVPTNEMMSKYYTQLGCSDDSTQSIAVNIYSDNTCETRSEVDGYDDANVDLSELEVSLGEIGTTENDITFVDFHKYVGSH